MEMRRSNSMGEVEPKDLKKYKGQTKRQCPQCGKSVMFIKLSDSSALVIECPNCDLVEHHPSGTAQFL